MSDPTAHTVGKDDWDQDDRNESCVVGRNRMVAVLVAISPSGGSGC